MSPYRVSGTVVLDHDEVIHALGVAAVQKLGCCGKFKAVVTFTTTWPTVFVETEDVQAAINEAMKKMTVTVELRPE